MSEESLHSQEDPQRLIDSFVRPIWYHELLTDQTRSLREQAKNGVEDVLVGNHIGLDSVIAIPTGGSRWTLEGNDPIHYQFLFLEDIPPLDDVRHALNDNWILPRDWDSSERAISHLERSNALKALMITPDNFVVGNVEKARELRLKALKKGGKGWWHDGVTDYVDKKVNIWGKPKSDLDMGKLRFRRALDQRLAGESSPKEWEKGFFERLKNRKTPPYSDYSHALEQLGGAINCPENRNIADPRV